MSMVFQLHYFLQMHRKGFSNRKKRLLKNYPPILLIKLIPELQELFTELAL